MSAHLGCNQTPEPEVNQAKSLEQVLGVDASKPSYCGVAGLAKADQAPFRAQMDVFLKNKDGQPSDTYIKGGSQELREFTAATLVAVPPVVLYQVFNSQFQGQIILSDERVTSICQENSQGTRPVYGCARKLAGQALQFFLRESKSVIGVKLLQLFAQTMSRNIAGSETIQLGLVQDNNLIKQQLDSFVRMRLELLTAFESDIAGLDSQSALAFHRLSRDEKLHYVFSHTVDSAYCSADHLANFESMHKDKKFSNTFKHFFGLDNGNGESLSKVLGQPWFK